MLTRSLGVLAFIIGIFHLSNDDFLMGVLLSFVGLYLFRTD